MADQPLSLGAVHQVAELLEGEAVPYAFIGGIAVNTWGLPRATFDLDLAASVPAERSSSILTRFAQEGFVVDSAFQSGFRDRIAGMEQIHMHLPVGSSLLAVDVFFADTPFLRSVLDRKVGIELAGRLVQVCTAADLILLKLIADRPKDRLDIANVLAVQGVPERNHLERWANELNLGDRLERALQGAG